MCLAARHLRLLDGWTGQRVDGTASSINASQGNRFREMGFIVVCIPASDLFVVCDVTLKRFTTYACLHL